MEICGEKMVHASTEYETLDLTVFTGLVMRIPADAEQRFRSIPNSHFDWSRTLIPENPEQ